MPKVGIIGAGITGLTAAYRLHKDNTSVHVFEATDRVGGVIQSERSDGFLVEHGPNSLRPNTEPLREVIRALDLASECVPANSEASTRYVVRDGRPLPLPMSVGSFLTTDLFSTWAKLRLLVEPFIRRRTSAPEESVADFTRRRLGSEVLNYAVAPFVGGVFAGDPEQLSARHAFERLVQLEEEYGSLLWGGLRAGGSSSTTDCEIPSGLFSFRDGLETLPNALARTLGDRISCDTPVTGLRHDGSQWRVHGESSDGTSFVREFDAVVSSIPLHEFARLNLDLDPSPLTDVPYPPVSVLALGYEREAIDHPLDGFGVLVPPIEDTFDILGTIFSSTLFPNRAPDGHVLLTTFVGGSRAPEQVERSPSALQSLVERDLNRLLGVNGPPTFIRHVHWPRAIPQFTLGYGRVKEALAELEHRHSGLVLAGNYREGVSVGDAMASGAAAAERILSSNGSNSSA